MVNRRGYSGEEANRCWPRRLVMEHCQESIIDHQLPMHDHTHPTHRFVLDRDLASFLLPTKTSQLSPIHRPNHVAYTARCRSPLQLPDRESTDSPSVGDHLPTPIAIHLYNHGLHARPRRRSLSGMGSAPPKGQVNGLHRQRHRRRHRPRSRVVWLLHCRSYNWYTITHHIEHSLLPSNPSAICATSNSLSYTTPFVVRSTRIECDMPLYFSQVSNIFKLFYLLSYATAWRE